MTSPPNQKGRIAVWRVGGSVASGVLVVLAFPRFGSEVGLDWLVWMALTPFLLAAVGEGARRGILLGASMGVTIEAAGFLWILLAMRRFTELPSVLTSLGFLLWVLYTAVPWALLGGVVGRSRPATLPWVVPFWVGLEHLYPRLFPWHLGGALHARSWLLQTVDIWGASGLTALVLIASLCAFYVIRALQGRGRWPRGLLVAFALLLGASLLYGALREEGIRRAEEAARSFRVALFQGAMDPRFRRETGFERYVQATRTQLSSSKVDLVVWPEGAADDEDSLPFDLDPASNSKRSLWTGRDLLPPLQALADEFSTPLVVGGTGFRAGRDPMFSNVSVYVQPGQPACFYEKNVRLAFGEVVPFLEWIPRSLRESLGIRVGTIAAGHENPACPFRGARFRNLICYEAILPGYVADHAQGADFLVNITEDMWYGRTAHIPQHVSVLRLRVVENLPGYVADHAQGADFLVNITEDMWYGRTAHIPQHVSVLRLRVVENRTPLVRCANVGPSGVLWPSGRFEHGSRVFEPEEIVTTFPAWSQHTVYQSAGRYLPIVLVGAWLASRVLRRSQKDCSDEGD
jgi:apolipoprotein N-acyltransferase